MVLVPHGHYRDAYTRNGLNVRKRYDIPEDAYLFAFIGRVSPYKGIDQLLASFQELSDERTHLLIAGKPSEDVDQSTWNAAVRQENVHLSLDFVEDGELADYIHGADCIVLPYRNITTSGSAILALSCLRPVVAPNIGLLSDYLTPETSILYDPVEPGALTRSMKEIREKMSFYRDAGPYEQKLEELEWKRVSELLVGVYNSV
jgi:glycosyltransferase involved in cell wall biosynthesis